MSNTFPSCIPTGGLALFFRRLVSVLCNRYVAFLLVLFCYTLFIEHLGGLKGGWVFTRQYLEIGQLLYLYWYLNAIVRPSRWQPFLAAAPIFLAYIGQDIYYLLLAKVFRFIELTEVAELFNVTSRKFLVLIILAGAHSALWLSDLDQLSPLGCDRSRRPAAGRSRRPGRTLPAHGPASL